MKTRAVRPQEAFGDRLVRAMGAHRRSTELLMTHLSDEQRDQLAQQKSFQVIGGVTGKVYTIHWGKSGNIVTDDCRYCCYPSNRTPIADVLLAQKMWLESSSELEFINKANKFMLRGWGR